MPVSIDIEEGERICIFKYMKAGNIEFISPFQKFTALLQRLEFRRVDAKFLLKSGSKMREMFKSDLPAYFRDVQIRGS